MSKIVYIVKNKLHYYPPCVSQIRMIKDLGYDIDVLYGTSDENTIKILSSENINCIKIPNISEDNSNVLKKIKIWLNYRKQMKKLFKEYKKVNTIFWFGTAESCLPLKGLLNDKKYVCFVLELMDEYKLKLLLMKKLMQRAIAVCVCENTRAYLQKNWWKLKNMPYVFPNKPYKPMEYKIDTNNSQLTDAFSMIGNSKYILYQGILQNKEELIEIANALNSTKEHLKFVLMGIDKYNCIDEIKKIYKDTIYIKYIPAPLHLEITKNAYIGIAYYRDDSLNKVFCAPNKIYEYSNFSIPMLCNDVPGLTNTVGKYGAAECVAMKEKNIIKAINNILMNYETYSANSKKFYLSTDNFSKMKELMSNIENNENKEVKR